MSDISFYDSQIWLVSKPNKVPNVEILMRLYLWDAWLAIVVTMIIVALSWWLIAYALDDSYFNSFVRSLTGTFSLLLNLGFTKKPTSFSLKLLFIAYAIFAIHISYYFQGELSSMLTQAPYQRGIRSVVEMIQTPSVTPLTYIDIKESFKDLNTSNAKMLYEKTQLIREAKLNNIFNKMIQFQNTSSTAYRSEITSYYMDKLRILGSQFAVNMEAVYPVRKGHPLLSFINAKLQKIHEGGYWIKWRKEVTEEIVFTTGESHTHVLSMQHVQGAFDILLYGYAFGLILFILECIVKVIANEFKNSTFTK